MILKLKCKRDLSIIPIMLVLTLAILNIAILSPALPAMKSFYNISAPISELIIIIFLAGYALSQISFGPIANIIGYKKSLLFGILIGLTGTLLCIISSFVGSFFLMLVGRFIEGFGVSCGLALGFAIINELYEGKAVRDVTTYGLMVGAILPALSNSLGGYLTFHLNWIFCFYFLVIWNLLVLFTCVLIPESLDNKERSEFSVKTILNGYISAINNQKIVLGGITYGIFAAIFYSTIGLLPYIGIEDLALTAETFGFLFLLSYLGYFKGTVISKLTTRTMSAKTSMLFGIIISLIGACIFLFCSLVGFTNSIIVFVCVYIVFTGLPFVFINSSALAISSHNDKANASSIFNFIFSLFALVSVLTLQFLKTNPIILLPSIIVALLIFGLFICRRFLALSSKR